MNTFFTLIFAVLGASVGSFISVLIHRTRHYETGIVKGRSKCTHCKRILEPIDLIPILSYIMLRGRCRKCEKQISSSYLVIEVLSAAVFALLYSQNPFVIGSSVHGILEESVIAYNVLFTLLYKLIIAGGLITIFFYDLMYKEIPDMFSVPLIALAIIGGIVSGIPNALSMLLGATIGVAFFGSQFMISKGRWIGGGDIRLGAFMGIFLGWKMLLLALFISYIIGATYSIALLLLRKLSGKSEIAFGPFLIMGTVIASTYGMEILNWYFSFTGL